MILIDSSAWVEYLRDTGSAVCQEVDVLLAGRIATTEQVQMEVLAGARDVSHLEALTGLLGRAQLLRCTSEDFLAAADNYRACRAGGRQVRQLADCLIAAVASRHDTPVLHADADFDSLAAIKAVRVHLPGR